jgi:hypothetical protein
MKTATDLNPRECLAQAPMASAIMGTAWTK